MLAIIFWAALLTGFTKSSKFGAAFNDNELLSAFF